MYEVTCLDSYGEVVDHLMQWDMNQSLFIKDIELTEAPMFHFCNKNSSEALVVPSTISDDNTIVVKIPNSLLQEPFTIIAYMYAYSDSSKQNTSSISEVFDSASAKTLVAIKIPVRPRVKPSDYQYVENIDSLTAVQIETNLKNQFSEFENSVNLRITAQNRKIANQDTTIDDFIQETDEQLTQFKTWQDEQTAKFDSWLAEKQTAYDEWFNNLTETLTINANMLSQTFEAETDESGLAALPFTLKSNQTIYVFINGVFAVKEKDYIIESDEIQLVDTDSEFTSGNNVITFIVFESTINI